MEENYYKLSQFIEPTVNQKYGVIYFSVDKEEKLKIFERTPMCINSKLEEISEEDFRWNLRESSDG